MIGTSIGRSGAQPSGWRIAIIRPSTSTVSPRRSARNAPMYWSTRLHGSGRCPSMARAVNPVPTTTASRPGATCSMVAIADAVASTWRRCGMTSAPRPMLLGVVGDARERHPDVPVQRGRVVEVDASVAELLGALRPLDAVRPRWEAAGEVHRHERPRGSAPQRSTRCRRARARAGSSGRARTASPSGTRMMCVASVNAICARAHGTGFTATISGSSSRTRSASRKFVPRSRLLTSRVHWRSELGACDGRRDGGADRHRGCGRG